MPPNHSLTTGMKGWRSFLMFLVVFLTYDATEVTAARASTKVKLPMPTSETLPYVAEVMGATSFEESLEEEPAQSGSLEEGGGPASASSESRRVQRKLAGPENRETDLDQEEEVFTDYQGVIGRPGVDFPVLPSIPKTDFSCRKVKSSGYYADLETDCQVFHICDGGRKISFLCPNGTVFRQSHLICDWWFRVDCERSVEQYEESAEQLAHDQMIYKARAEEIAKAMAGKLVKKPTTIPPQSDEQYQQQQNYQQQQYDNQQHGLGQQKHQRQQQSQQRQQFAQQRQQNREQVYQQQQNNQQEKLDNLQQSRNQEQHQRQQLSQQRQQNVQQRQRQHQQDHQQQQQRQQQYQQQQKQTDQQQYQQQREEEHERQVPAETASFASSRHRFGNQLENQYRQYISSTTSTTQPPQEQRRDQPQEYDLLKYKDFFATSTSTASPSIAQTYDTSVYYDYTGSTVGSTELPYYTDAQRTYTNSPALPYDYKSETLPPQETPLPEKLIAPAAPSTSNLNSRFPSRGNTNYYQSQLFRDTENIDEYSEEASPSGNNFVSSTTARPVTNKIVTFENKTPRPDKYTSTKRKPIFDVKIKPTKDTKDITYLELLRHEEDLKNYGSSKKPEYTTPSTPASSTHSGSRNTYLPKPAKKDEKENLARYASINISGMSEEIRPEYVNALMEARVTPTSAKALQTLASYISSGAAGKDYANVYGDDERHPHVSDVLLKYHSGNQDSRSYTGAPTLSTPTSSSGEVLPSVLTKATKESYSYLFSDSKETDDKKAQPEFLDIDQTTKRPVTTTAATTPAQTTMGKQDLKLKDSTELRELAQVFSRALSAYLEDPETFKEILAQVRPTEPSVDNTTPSMEEEVLDFSDAILGRQGTTQAPITTFGSDYVDDNLSIGEINSLAAGKGFEPDNSLEHITFPPTAPEARQETSAAPKLLFFNQRNDTTKNDYYSKLGSAEDQSYFPTVGGVSDSSRPRYGGFQNNTNQSNKNQKAKSSYSPYGADVPKDITGAPISSSFPTTVSPLANLYTQIFGSSSTSQHIPEPHDVNSLIRSDSDRLSSEEAYDTYQTSPSTIDSSFSVDKERLLIASGSQSLVSSDNYLEYAKKFNQQQIQESKKSRERFLKTDSLGRPLPSPQTPPANTPEDLTSYFGQEPPAENLGQPSGFRAQTDEKTGAADPVNYHIGDTATEAPRVQSSSWFPSPSSDIVSSTWTVSPVYDVTSSGTSLHFNFTSGPPPSSSPSKYLPTTYHPTHSTTPAYDQVHSPSTPEQSADLKEYKEFEKAAKEMFGMLNTTMAEQLMDLMAKGESNMTIRRLVLLLVNSKNDGSESRESLVRALLTNTEEMMATLPPESEVTFPSSTPSTSTKSSKEEDKSKRRSRARGKTSRGTDDMTGNHGTTTTTTTTTANTENRSQLFTNLNKMNAAKLYIPSAESSNSLRVGPSKMPLDSDARAVELLKTLYSLATKWG